MGIPRLIILKSVLVGSEWLASGFGRFTLVEIIWPTDTFWMFWIRKKSLASTVIPNTITWFSSLFCSYWQYNAPHTSYMAYIYINIMFNCFFSWHYNLGGTRPPRLGNSIKIEHSTLGRSPLDE